MRRNVNGCPKLAGLTEQEFTRILEWPGRGVYRPEIDEQSRTLRWWGTPQTGKQDLDLLGYGGRPPEIVEREVRHLPWRKSQTAVMIEAIDGNFRRRGRDYKESGLFAAEGAGLGGSQERRENGAGIIPFQSRF